MKKVYLILVSVVVFADATMSQNVGVDVATPVQKLDVAGGLRLGTTANGVAGSMRWNGSNFQVHDGTQWITFGAGTDHDWAISGTDMYSEVAGNVGIGTSTPAEKLQVVGTARVSALNVNGNYTLPITDGGAGFVLTTDGSGTVSWSNPTLVGDITSVVAGDGLVNGGTSGDVTLDVNPGDGIELVSDQVRVKASDLDNAANGLTSTGNDFAVNVDNSTLDLNGDELRVKPDGIGATQIATGGVGSSEIADGSVSSVDIATGGVASVDILDGTIVPADIASPGNSQILTTSGTGTVQWITQSAFLGAQDGDGLIFDGTEIDVNPGDGINVASNQVSVDAADLQGNGLSVTSNNFNVNVDNATIEINSDILRVKAGGIQSSHIADGTVSSVDIATGGVASVDIADGTILPADISSPGNNQVLVTDGSGVVQWTSSTGANSALAGDGLVYDGANAELDVNPGDGIVVTGDQVRVNASDLDNINNGLTVTSNDFAINVDNATLEVNSDVLRVKANGIQSSHILNNTITAADIAAGGVATSEILNGTILPADISSPGNPNQVLSTNGSSVVGWYDPASLTTVLQDGDADTKITVDVGGADEDHIRMSTFGAERMTIDNNGNVGIGVTSPERNLHVASATGGQIVVTRSGTTNTNDILGEIQFDSEASSGPSTVDASALIRGISSNSPTGDSDKGGHLAFLTKPATTDANVAATERMRIQDDGDVLIGASNTSTNDLYIADRILDWDNTGYFIDINGASRMNEIQADDGSVSDPSFYFSGDANTGLYQPADNQMGVSINGTERMRFKSDGNVGVGTTNPLAKLDIRPADGAAAVQFLSSANDYPRIYMGGASTSVAFVINRLTTSATQYFGEDADAGGFDFRGSGSTRIGSLAGTGTRGLYATSTGVLTTSGPTSGADGYWTRSGTTLRPTSSADYVGVNTTAPAFNFDVPSGRIRLSSNVGINRNPEATSSGYRLAMGGSIHMYDNDMNYVHQVHFNDNVRFYDEGNDSYLNFKYGDTGAGGIKIYDGNSALQGYLYASGDNVNFGLLDADGNWAVRVNRDNSVMLYDNNQYTFGAGQGAISGDYGTVQTQSDGGKGNYEGYSIDGRYVFMSDDNNTMGLYNDINNRWVMLHERNSYTRFYEPDGSDYIYLNTNTDLIFRDNSIYDVNQLSVNTIYSEDDYPGVGPGDYTLFINDNLCVNISQTGQDFYVAGDDSRTTLRTQSANHGQVGRLQNYWYRHYVRTDYRLAEASFSDMRVKKNIRELDGASSLQKILSLEGKEYDLADNHPFMQGGVKIESNMDKATSQDILGFLAQDLQKVIPEMVVEDEESGYLIVVNYEQLFPVVVEAMKEQQKIIQGLEERIRLLEASK